jgi:hypothetical protein
MSNQSKKDDKFYQKFEWPLWFSDLDVRALPLDTRMIWAEIIGRMWLSNERGYLVGSNRKPLSDEAMAATLPLPVEEYRKHLEVIKNTGLCSVRKTDGAIYSRKILHDLETHEEKASAGRKGAKATWSGGATAGAKAIARAKALAVPPEDDPNAPVPCEVVTSGTS